MFPVKGSAIPVKKVVGALMFVVGLVTFLNPEKVTTLAGWNILIGFLMLVASFFLLIAGRQL